MALTDKVIRALKPKAKPYQVADGGGLVLEVMPGGAKVWRQRYRLASRPQKATIGKYPAVTLAEARHERERIKIMLAEGRSPASEHRAERRAENKLSQAENSVEAFARLWFIDVVKKVNKNPRDVSRYVEKDIIPVLGRKQLGDVTPADVLDLCDRIKKRGADQSALAVRNILKRIYAYAIASQRAQFNPAAAIQAQYIATAKSRDRALTKDEVVKLLRSIYASSMRRAHKLALHLLLLTMVRKAELVEAKWEHIDLEASEWHIPETKIGKPHVVYLSRQARELFAELKELACGSPYVLPSRSSLRQPISHTTLNVTIRALGLEIADFVLHDFRRTASTHLHEAGFLSDVVEKALAHTIGGVRGVYNRAEYAEQRRVMLQQWSDMVETWIEGSKLLTGQFGKAA
jgi:integrase